MAFAQPADVQKFGMTYLEARGRFALSCMALMAAVAVIV
jgi:hypothetical protein